MSKLDTLSDVFQGQAISVGKTAAGYHDNINYPANEEATEGKQPENACSYFPDVESVDSQVPTIMQSSKATSQSFSDVGCLRLLLSRYS